MASRLLLAVAVVAGCAVGLSGATIHIVGANHGWKPNINYTLWSRSQTFSVGDLVSFRYQNGTHNVFEVNETGYGSCTMDGVAGNWTSGKDFVPLVEPRRYFFICGNGFCQAGMKVAITVIDQDFQFHDHGPEMEPDCSADCGTAAASVAARLMVTALAVAIAVVG
ncbi:mavicyanin-like [Lolium rigidum]|uniref:mavicyanin-like n=1 Tax=Lolium rigidum TaxID=89674 RepID=UPI001F5C6BED|nr:mavicyanin-like [Lolium rigidum]